MNIKPYVARVYYKDEKGKVRYIEIKKFYLNDLLPICQEYERRYHYQWTIKQAGSPGVVRRSRQSSYWNKAKEPEEVQLSMF